jgi:ATP-binding cassette subfamily B protein
MFSFPFFRQLDQMDCGAACLKMIAKYYGEDYSIQYLRDICHITRQGVTLLDLSDASESIGFKCLALPVDFDTLLQAPMPCIVYWRQRHFVVVFKTTSRHIHVADPAFGLIKYTHEKFKAGWFYNLDKRQEGLEGYALFLEKTKDFGSVKDPGEKVKKNLSFLLPYIRQHRRILYHVFAGLFVSSAIQISFPFLTRSVVDRGINTGNIPFIYVVLAAQLMLFLSQTFIEVIRRRALLYMSRKINVAIGSDFLQRLIDLPVSFFDARMRSDLYQRIEDQKQIDSFLSSTSLSMLFSLVNVLLFAIVLFFFNPFIFILFLAGSLLYFSWVSLFVSRRMKLSYQVRDEAVENRSSVNQILEGMEEIKLNNSERKRKWEWESVQNKVYSTSMKVVHVEQLQVIGGNFILQVTNIIITFISALAVINGHMTLGAMLATQYIIGQLSVPLNNFVTFVQGAGEAKVSIQRISEVMNTDKETKYEEKETRHKEKGASTDSLVLDDLSFKYGGKSSRLVLQHINLLIPHGKVTAIVGSSGSGKTTLMKLLLKFYHPTLGTISVGKDDLSNVNSKSWRERCGVVMQNGFIFADTLLRNITESEKDHQVDKERLSRAITIANLGSVIENLPLGLKTNLSLGGVDLSGGESQRVLIARAIYKNPDYIFFDEATSALDANNEKTIIGQLQDFFVGKTVLVIAHRLSTVKNADKIIVLEKGRVIEEGTHQELVTLKQNYFKLVKNQLELGD